MTRCRIHGWRPARLLTARTARTAALACGCGAAAVATAVVGAPVASTGLGFLAAGLGIHLIRSRHELALEWRLARALLAERPTCSDSRSLTGLTGSVRVETSSQGTPCISGASLSDVVRALGYVQARDRGFQMDLARRSAAGRLAEVWGKFGLSHDLRMRPLRLGRVAEQAVRQLEPEERELLDAFASGVNDYWRDHRQSMEGRFLGYSMAPWQPRDSILVAAALFHGLSGDEQVARADDVVRRVLPDELVEVLIHPGRAEVSPALSRYRRPVVPEAAEPVVLDTPVLGSNAWAVRGPDGAVLACDLHLPLQAPNATYDVMLEWPGHRVRGVVCPGLPVVVAGSNGHLAWGVTNRPSSAVSLGPETWANDVEESPEETEEIHVRGSRPVVVSVASSSGWRRLATGTAKTPVALRWVGQDPAVYDLRLQRLARLRTVDEAVTEMDAALGISLNLVLADEHGATAHLTTGPAGLDGLRPFRVSGQGEAMVSANDDAFGQAGSLEQVPDFDPGHRARRIRSVLEDAPHDHAAARRLQHDTLVEALAPFAALAIGVADPRLAAELDAWDGTADRRSRILPTVVAFRNVVVQRVLAPYLAPAMLADPDFRWARRTADRAVLRLLESRDVTLLPLDAEDQGWDAFLHSCLEEAQRRVRTASRGSRLPWGALTTFRIEHPFSPLARGARGLLDHPVPGQSGSTSAVRCVAPGFGASMRLVAMLPGGVTLEQPGGQSGHPLSVHYADRHRLWTRMVPDLTGRLARGTARVCTETFSPAAFDPPVSERADHPTKGTS